MGASFLLGCRAGGHLGSVSTDTGRARLVMCSWVGSKAVLLPGWSAGSLAFHETLGPQRVRERRGHGAQEQCFLTGEGQANVLDPAAPYPSLGTMDSV